MRHLDELIHRLRNIHEDEENRSVRQNRHPLDKPQVRGELFFETVNKAVAENTARNSIMR